MSSDKLPPIAICSRRDKTMLGLNLQRSLKSGTKWVSGSHNISIRSRYLLQDAVQVYTSHRDGFLPEDPIKSSSKKLDPSSPRVSSKRDVFFNEGLPSNRTKLPRSGVKMESTFALPTNMQESITLQRKNTNLFVTMRPSGKSKKRPVAKFTQLHKLGLEQTFLANKIRNTDQRDEVSSTVVNHKTEQKTNVVEISHDGFDSPRNVTSKFRVKGNHDKKCVSPVQFKPNGLPYEIQKKTNMEVIQSIAKADDIRKMSSSVDLHVSVEKQNGTNTIQLIDQFRNVIPEVVKLKHETRDLYPIFDWTEQRREDMMKKRFLDPVLKTFNAEYSGSDSQRSNKAANDVGRELHDDYKFTPDKRHLELENKLMSQYRQRYRRVSHDVTGMRSPSFSPLLNPPPSAMEFNIFDLDCLLELERPTSPQVPIPLETKPENTGCGAPAVNGVACQPVSTAMVWSYKTKPTDAVPTLEIPNKLIESEPSDNEYFAKKEDTANRKRELNDTTKDHPIGVIEESPHEHPVQVIIRIINDKDKQNEVPSDLNHVPSETNVSTNSTFKQGGLSTKASSGAFLNVPRVDVSFEERIPSFHAPGLNHQQSPPVSSTNLVAGVASESKDGPPKNPTTDRQLTTNQQTQDIKKIVSNKSIKFISPTS